MNIDVIKFLQQVKSDFRSYLVAFLLFLNIPPYFLWGSKLLPISVVLIAILCLSKITKITKINVLFFFFLFFFYLYISFQLNSNLFGYIATLCLPFILLSSDFFLKKVFDKFSVMYSFLLIPSLLVYFLILLGGVKFNYNTIEPLNSLKSNFYYQYPFLVMPSLFDDISFRFFSYFDEPGVVGTISGVLLLTRKIDFKNWITYPLLISGICSLSFAFFIMLAVNVLVFQQIKTKILVILLSIIAYTYLSTNEIAEQFIFSRFKIEDGKVAGDNRTISSFDDYWNYFVQSNNFMFGDGNQKSLKVNQGGASYKDLIIDYGFIPFSVFIISLFCFSWRKTLMIKPFFISAVITVSILYQRPFITNIIYYSLLLLPIFYLKFEYGKRE